MRKRFLRFMEVLLGAILLMVSVPVVVQAMADEENVAATEEANARDGGVAINEANFPDSAFRSYISKGYDADKDGILSPIEIASVITIYADGENISDLSGMRIFSNLETLSCSGNQLTTLDVGGCTALRVLDCKSCQLTSLDVSGCAALEDLDCRGNQLTTLDVSGCAALERLWCHQNQLTTLDASGCTALEDLQCDENQLTSLDVSGCAALEILSCCGVQLTTLDLSGCAALKELACYNNQLTTLDVSGCAALECLICNNNQLTTLDLSMNEVLSNVIKNGEWIIFGSSESWSVLGENSSGDFTVDKSVKTKLSDGTFVGPFTAAATLKAKDITATASPSKAQTFKISYTYNGDGKVSFKSNNAKVTVDENGKVTVAKNFAGKAVITVSAPATKKFQAASTTITVTVKQIANTITANAVTKTSAALAQSFTLSVKQKGTGKLSYKSNNKSVKVTSAGKVTIAKNFSGRATITVKAAAAGGYKAASKNVVITVNPAAVTVSPAKNLAGQKVSLTWKKAPGAGGYQIQYSTSKNFSNKKSITVKSADTLKATLTKLTKGKTYYIRIRAYKKDAAGNLFSAWKSFKAVKVTK